MTGLSMEHLRALVGSVVVATLFAASPAAAQNGSCAGVIEDGCLGDFPCRIVEDQEFGSVEWEHSGGCLEECPDPEHCQPEVASNAAGLSNIIAQAIDHDDVLTLQAVSDEAQAVFNLERNALQVIGCVDGVVVAHFPLREEHVLALKNTYGASEASP